MEFFHLEPWGWEAECYQAGIVAATIANVNRDQKKKARPFDAVDFVPGRYERKKQPKIDGKVLKARLIAAYAGLHDGRPDNIRNQGREGVRSASKGARPAGCPKDRR